MNFLIAYRWQLTLGLLIAFLSAVGCAQQSGDKRPTQLAFTLPAATMQPSRNAATTRVPLSQAQSTSPLRITQQITQSTLQPTVALPTVTPTPNQPPILLPTATAPSLLPTVTPTPLAPLTLIDNSAWANDPDAPLAYRMEKPAYYDDLNYVARQGITYVDASKINHQQDNSACLNGAITAQTSIFQGDGCLAIILDDGRRLLFHDINATTRSVYYYYIKSLPEINSHLIQTRYWEGGEYLIVHQATGHVTVVPFMPIASPNYRYLAMSSFGWDNPTVLYVQIWQIGEEIPNLVNWWRVERLPYQLFNPTEVLTWESAEHINIQWTIDIKQSQLLNLNASMGQAGWMLDLNDWPLPNALIEYNSMHFALGGLDRHTMLDTLVVGKPTYTDRPYIFVAVPKELEGATYFRIPQYYFLGESPDYFPESVQKGHYLRFRVIEDAHIYVALDAQLHQPPDWLAGWQAVDLKLENDDIALQLYRKAYPAWSWVELVDRWMEEGRVPTQFIVIITPQDNE